MIIGFNTDIEHNGVVYHVQTEDKGLDSPFLLSLVYAGGAILASKRSRYDDLIAAGFNDEALAERLKRQHRLICAAIRSGRLDDLKRMDGRLAEAPQITSDAPVENAEEVAPTPEIDDEKLVQSGESSEVAPEGVPEPERERVRRPRVASDKGAAYSVYDPRRQAVSKASIAEEGLIISLMDDQEFYSGDEPTLRILISHRSGAVAKPLANVAISVKILGTTFRPLIYSSKTHRDGVATIEAKIPDFSSGRAAVLIRAAAKGGAAELRRVVHPRK